MADKSKKMKRSGKSVKQRTTHKKDDMTTTYVVVGLLVALMLFLLYSMNTIPAQPMTTTTAAGIIDSVVNAVVGGSDETTKEGFTEHAASELYDPEKEVLVVFCKMEGCGHCVNFQEDVWSKVEPKLNNAKSKSGKTIKMMTVDPKHALSDDVRGFPTIKMYGANPAEYVEFKDKRTVDNFTNFCMQ
jgi:hypothetical protein